MGVADVLIEEPESESQFVTFHPLYDERIQQSI